MIANVQYTKGVAITPDDSVKFVRQGSGNRITCDAIYVGGAGIVAVVFEDGSVVNFTCIAGQILPVRAVRVNNSVTSATLLVALYAV